MSAPSAHVARHRHRPGSEERRDPSERARLSDHGRENLRPVPEADQKGQRRALGIGEVDQIRVVFLGTSAGLPSRQRNVASVAVILDGRVLLFDCGEGTQQQLLRSSVRAGAIEAIFITHLHGDHLYGLPGLLATATLSGREAPLTVYGPAGIHDYLSNVIRTTRLGFTYDIQILEFDEGEVRRGEGYRVVAAPLDHTTLCFGFAVIEDDR